LSPFSVFVLVLAGSVLLIEAGWSDYEVYRKKGFVRVYEIVEKTKNSDGTWTVKAHRSKSDPRTVELPDVVEIKEVGSVKGIEMKAAPVPTPTILFPSHPQPSAKKGNDLSEYPVLQTFLKDFKYAFIGGLALVILLFVVFRSSG